MKPSFAPVRRQNNIDDDLLLFFDKYHTMKLSNYIISDDEMERLVGSPVSINECKHKRKE